MGYELLPGRLAVLVPDREQGPIIVPDAVWRRWQDFGKVTAKRHETAIRKGVVVARGRDRGGIPLPPVGTVGYIVMDTGLTVGPNDLDIPSIGATVPAGHKLRIVGIRSSGHWSDSFLVMEEECA